MFGKIILAACLISKKIAEIYLELSSQDRSEAPEKTRG